MKRSVLLLLGVAAVTVAIALVARRYGWTEPARLGALAVRFRRGHDPSVTAPIFVLVFAAATAFGVPGSPFMLVSGVLFGVGRGAALSMLGVLLGGALGYGVARLVGRGAVERLLRRHHHIERAMRCNAFWTLLRVRLIPVIPLSVGNVIAGLARMPLHTFLLATLIGVAPFALVYAYFASSLLWGPEATKQHVAANLALASVALVAVSFLPMVARRVRRARRARA